MPQFHNVLRALVIIGLARGWPAVTESHQVPGKERIYLGVRERKVNWTAQGLACSDIESPVFVRAGPQLRRVTPSPDVFQLTLCRSVESAGSSGCQGGRGCNARLVPRQRSTCSQNPAGSSHSTMPLTVFRSRLVAGATSRRSHSRTTGRRLQRGHTAGGGHGALIRLSRHSAPFRGPRTGRHHGPPSPCRRLTRTTAQLHCPQRRPVQGSKQVQIGAV